MSGLAAEGAAAKGPLAGALAAGVNTLDLNQEVPFVRYTKYVLPIDGSVFWVKATLMDAGIDDPVVEVSGSLHYAQTQAQREDETFGITNVVFTALEPIAAFNDIEPDTLYIGTFPGLDPRFAFSSQGPFYKQADLYHYRGEAIYPAFESQVIDDPTQLLDKSQVVSNSLPIWLTLNKFAPVYPSFLVGENIRPPYVAVHIPEESTRTFAAGAVLAYDGGRAQLASDKVRLTLYGFRNGQALDFLDYVVASMGDSDAMGLQNFPAVRDAKRTQNELTVLAQKKTIEFEVSYLQSRARAFARQLILSALCPVIVEDNP